ncbi:MAG TPA: hypothetical protein EYM99_03020, partial [Alphaproteobacteria bacterium]|nr:hypothetical protein [Alphaproteobacteria bacterium]
MVLRRQPVSVLRAPVLGVVLFLTVVATYAETNIPYDPRCIDRVNISVDDQTRGVFFSEYTQKKLRKNLRDIHTITDLQIQSVKKAIEQCEDNAKMGWCDDQKVVMSETKFLVRTVWKGGIRDLWFTSASEKVADTAGPAVKLILGYSVNGGPQLEVAGDTCQYRSPADVTMLASFPEKTSGAKQNFHDLASFVSHQLITLSETAGCNLGSDAKSVVIKVAANGKTKPLPGRVEFLTYEASAMKSSRHERSSLAAVDEALAASGQTTIEIFNRPTNVRYRLAHPRDFGDWLDVHEQRVADDYVCGVFSPKVKVGPAPVFDLPSERLDKASINLQIDGGHAFLQDYPNFAFRIHWYSPGRTPVLITQSTDFVQPSPFQKVSEVEIRG